MDTSEPADVSDGSKSKVKDPPEYRLLSTAIQHNLVTEQLTELKKVVKPFKIASFQVVHCSACSKTCQGFEAVQNHLLMHFKVSPHTCMVCQEKFPCRETLRQHLFLHCLVSYKCDCHLAISTTSFDKFQEHLSCCHNGQYKHRTSISKLEKKHEVVRMKFPNYNKAESSFVESALNKEQVPNTEVLKTKVNGGNTPDRRSAMDNTKSISFNIQEIKNRLVIHTKHSSNFGSILARPNQEIKSVMDYTTYNSLLRKSHCCIDDSNVLQSEDQHLVKLFSQYSCPLCYFINGNKNLILQHLFVHIEADTYMCTLCTYVHASPQALLQHMDAHVKKNYKCDKCDFMDDEDHKFLLHYKAHLTSGGVDDSSEDFQQSRNNPVSHCKETIVKKSHKLSFSSKAPKKKKVEVKLKSRYFCSSCPESYREKPEYLRHEGRHTGNPSHVCEVCGKQFFTRGSYSHHAAIHVNSALTCDLCGQTYASIASLHTHHLTVHERRVSHLCPICGKGFPLKVRLTKHVRIHTGAKPYTCEFCGKMFNQKGNLAQHRRLHTGERPYSCEYCGKRFALRAAYTQHVRIHTGMKASELKRRNAAILNDQPTTEAII